MLTILWARLMFDEALGTSQWIGVGLVLAGLVAFSLRKAGSGSDDSRHKVRQPVDDPV